MEAMQHGQQVSRGEFVGCQRELAMIELTYLSQGLARFSAKVDGIIHATHDEMKSVRDKCESDVEGLRMKARDQIRLVLTDEQKPKFEQMAQRMDAERKRTAAQGK